MIHTFGSSEIDSITSAVQGDDVAYTEQDHRGSVGVFGTLGSITKRTDDDDKEEGNVELEDDFENEGADSIDSHPRERTV